ncbi:MAG: hypothetical protein JNG84_00445, partial [Archangium sp.]|nr:hypothetical protein [Archangium sp.]
MRRDALVQLFVAPLPLFAVALLAINDHLLKGSGLVPALVTGKLSDFAGLFFFPLFLAGLVSWLWAPPARLERALVAGCAVLTVFAFAAIKLWAPADDLYERVLGALRGVSRVSNVRDA